MKDKKPPGTGGQKSAADEQDEHVVPISSTDGAPDHSSAQESIEPARPQPAPELPEPEPEPEPTPGTVTTLPTPTPNGAVPGSNGKGSPASPDTPPPSEPPEDEADADASTKEARLELYEEKTRGRKIKNDTAEARGEIENEGLEEGQRTTNRERYFLMGFMAFGSIGSFVMAALGAVHHEPAFYSGTGVGALITGGCAIGLTVRLPGRKDGQKAKEKKKKKKKKKKD